MPKDKHETHEDKGSNFIKRKDGVIVTKDLYIRLQKERELYSVGKAQKGKTISRKAIAELMGISFSCLCSLERGDSCPTLDVLVKIAEFYGVSTDYLLGLRER